MPFQILESLVSVNYVPFAYILYCFSFGDNSPILDFTWSHFSCIPSKSFEDLATSDSLNFKKGESQSYAFVNHFLYIFTADETFEEFQETNFTSLGQLYSFTLSKNESIWAVQVYSMVFQDLSQFCQQNFSTFTARSNQIRRRPIGFDLSRDRKSRVLWVAVGNCTCLQHENHFCPQQRNVPWHRPVPLRHLSGTWDCLSATG